MAQDFLPSTGVLNINLDRLLAALEKAKPASTPVVAVKNDPPRIFVTYEKAILMLVDGEPVRAPIEKGQSGAERAHSLQRPSPSNRGQMQPGGRRR
jgi:hypothetical protein